MELVSVLRQIYQSEIDVTVRSRWNIGWQVEIENGQVARTMVQSLDDAAPWLHEQMMIHFPDSSYARRARGELRQAMPTEAFVRQLDAR